MNGIESVILDGKLPAKKRHAFIEEWKSSDVLVMIMSNVGMAGLNLAFVCFLILYVSHGIRPH